MPALERARELALVVDGPVMGAARRADQRGVKRRGLAALLPFRVGGGGRGGCGGGGGGGEGSGRGVFGRVVFGVLVFDGLEEIVFWGGARWRGVVVVGVQ